MTQLPRFACLEAVRFEPGNDHLAHHFVEKDARASAPLHNPSAAPSGGKAGTFSLADQAIPMGAIKDLIAPR